MSQELRTQILLLLERHAQTGSPAFVHDTELAEATGQSVEAIQRQLDILGSEGFIRSANAHNNYNARISPKGSLAVEATIEAAKDKSELPLAVSLLNRVDDINRRDEVFRKQDEAATTIKQIIEELAKIIKSSNTNYNMAMVLLGYWRKRSVRLLAEKVSANEGMELDRYDFIEDIINPESYFKLISKQYMDYLMALSIVLKQHPEEILYREVTMEARQMPTPEIKPKAVFVIHGHDDSNRLKLERLLRDRLKLDPIVILDTPSMGRTLIQMLDNEGKKASFAIALFTPDDIIQVGSSQYPQARPNVIFELGWFYGRLGPQKTCILLKTGTKIPSDLDGIKRIEFSYDVEESYLKIERELQAAGLLKN